MPSSFLSFFGNALNGTFVRFEETGNGIDITLISNMYARLPMAGCGSEPINILTDVANAANSDLDTYDTFEWVLAWRSTDTDCELCWDGVKAIA